MANAEKLAAPIKDAVNKLLFDKKINRTDCIEALEIASEDLSSAIDCLKDDEARAQHRAANK